ncbi:MAG TPA: outer membrane lipoprotein-sorting protein [Myxococcota bacterium]|nr:outer membrane lipoprotein-sorting protein [Myxococcota bacterium]
MGEPAQGRKGWHVAWRASARAALLMAALGTSAAQAGSPIEDLAPGPIPYALRESARSVLERAFDNLYGCDLRDEIEIEAHVDGKVVRRHLLRVLRKNIDGRAHMLIHFVTDNDYWDTRVLKIENQDRSDDEFVWTHALGRVRRVTSAQRADAFEGTDLTLEDLEVHRASRFEILGRAFSIVQGEPVHVLTIAPLNDVGYRRAILFIAQKDYVVLEAHYYRGENGRRPYKVSRAPRDQMLETAGHVLPQLWIFTDYERGTESWLRWHRRSIPEDLYDRMLSSDALETQPASTTR